MTDPENEYWYGGLGKILGNTTGESQTKHADEYYYVSYMRVTHRMNYYHLRHNDTFWSTDRRKAAVDWLHSRNLPKAKAHKLINMAVNRIWFLRLVTF